MGIIQSSLRDEDLNRWRVYPALKRRATVIATLRVAGSHASLLFGQILPRAVSFTQLSLEFFHHLIPLDTNRMQELETERARLRMFTPDDLDALARILGTSEVMLYLGREGKPMTREETETTLLSMIRHWERHGFGRWAVVLKGEETLIGCAGLRSYEGIAELVYLLDQPFWGIGLATEIAKACLRFGFEVQGFDRIIAFTRPQNIASRRVMEKLGMRYDSDVTVFEIPVAQYTLEQKEYRSDESMFVLHEV